MSKKSSLDRLRHLTKGRSIRTPRLAEDVPANMKDERGSDEPRDKRSQ